MAGKESKNENSTVENRTNENSTVENRTKGEKVANNNRADKKKFRLNAHFILLFIIILFIGLTVYKFFNFGNRITKEDIDKIPTPEDAEIQSYDYFIPNLIEDDGTFPEDDGETTVVCFGNAPFADDRNSDKNVCNLFAKNSGATVYNCSIPGSYMAAQNNPYDNSNAMDAFSFSYLADYFAAGNKDMVEQAYSTMGTVPADIKSAMNELDKIDFTKVDVIYVMYDASDYLDGSMVYHDEILDEPRYFTGSLTGGIAKIREAYPWIRIIVMSPTYAFAIDENGEYVSSDKQKNVWNVSLSLYFMKQFETAYREQVTFVDNFYGCIHEDIAKDYLTDNLHLNQAGREKVAQKMLDALDWKSN